MQPVLINGQWREANASGGFQASNPLTQEKLPEVFPVSTWQDCDAALDAAVAATVKLRSISGSQIADFLEAFAANIEANKDAIVDAAHSETALPKSPRLADGELPRTTGQLRQAAEAARSEVWRRPIIDTANNIRSCFSGIGPVCVFGPNNFPLAFGSASGGDFAAAIAAGNPVIGKANSSHPETTRLLAVQAQLAAEATGMPAGMVQLLYRTSHADGERLVADPRTGATGYTGSRTAGLKLKAAADAAGKPIYLELSSVNPVVILPGALEERFDDIAADFASSCLMGTGQFCTNPGMVLLLSDAKSEQFTATVADRFNTAPVGTLLSEPVQNSLTENLQQLIAAGAKALTPVTNGGGDGFSHSNVLLTCDGDTFLSDPEKMQTEAFGNASLIVTATDADQAAKILDALEGNLTGCIYSHTAGADDAVYAQLEPHLRPRVGRLLNDKMPTGVAVSPAMNHGGPYPATGDAGHTAVGLPTAISRFAMLQCYDAVRPSRLPACLQDESPSSDLWRCVDGQWKTGNV